MKVLTVYAHQNPGSFCHGVLEPFTEGLRDAGHASEVIDLYAIRFDPVFRDRDVASYIADDVPGDILELMGLRSAATRPGRGTPAIRVCDTGAWPGGAHRVRYA
jgi:NAD(P)H dehydrogenase (quinone)